MGTKIQVRKKFQITLPNSVRKRIKQTIEIGDIIEAEVEDNKIILYPKKLVDTEQAWFWTEEWQKGEKAADEDIKAGRVDGPFKNIEELKAHLEDR